MMHIHTTLSAFVGLVIVVTFSLRTTLCATNKASPIGLTELIFRKVADEALTFFNKNLGVRS